jgi:hypothetical protein
MVDAYLLREEGGTIADIDTAPHKKPEEKPEKALFCRFCGHLITYADRAVEVNDNHHHTFFNPAGIIFEIRLFSSATGCTVHGQSSEEFTWFAGYSWNLALCSACAAHMGWYFSSGALGFYGLIEKHLAF